MLGGFLLLGGPQFETIWRVRYYPAMANALEKISITVTPAMKRVHEEQVASGEFASASELMREAFRTWQKQQDEH